MMDYLRRLFDSDQLTPHGFCLLWRPGLMGTMVASDALIALAYFSIPVALAYFVRRRRDIAFNWVFWCFAVFIMACGFTHVMDIVTLWLPAYDAQAATKAITALASVATAVVLWPLIPRALALPSPEQLRRMNDDLAQRVAERDSALDALRREMTERQKTEDMLRQAQKMEAIGQLTGGLAHDFNNLMAGVLMNLNRARKQAAGARTPDRDEQLKRAVENASDGAERAAKLTSQLLAFARKQPLEAKALEVNPLITDLAPLLKNALGATRELKLALASDLAFVEVDGQQLEASLLNLIVNARDAIEATGCVTIATCAAPAGGESAWPAVVIEVADTGVGMAADIQSRIFDPFFTTKPVGKGSGLGLSQVYGFVRQSGGEIRVESAPGAGTRIRLFLPSLQRSQHA
jgi:signal transduction histidine kinase